MPLMTTVLKQTLQTDEVTPISTLGRLIIVEKSYISTVLFYHTSNLQTTERPQKLDPGFVKTDSDILPILSWFLRRGRGKVQNLASIFDTSLLWVACISKWTKVSEM